MLGLLLVLIGYLLHEDPTPLRSLGEISCVALALLVLLITLNQALTSWRLRLAMVECCGARLTHWEWFRLTSVGQFLNLFVPQLGHVYRAVVLKREHGMPYAAYVSGSLVFVWLESLTGLSIALVVVGSTSPRLRVGAVPVLPALAAAALGLLASAALLGLAELRPSGGSEWLRALRTRAAAVLSVTRRALAHPLFVLQFSALGCVVTACHIGTLWLAFDAVGCRLSIGQLAVFQIVLKLSSIIAITPGNLGTTELAYGVLASLAAGRLQQGIAAGMLMRTLGTFVLVALGVGLGGLPLLTARRSLTSTPEQANGKS